MGNAEYRCTYCGHTDELKNHCVKCSGRRERERESARIARDLREMERRARQREQDRLWEIAKAKQKRLQQIEAHRIALRDAEEEEIREKVREKKREMKAKANPYRNWSKADVKSVMSGIAARVENCGQAGEALVDMVDDIEDSLEKTLGSELEPMRKDLERYRDYGSALKGLKDVFTEACNATFNETKCDEEDEQDTISMYKTGAVPGSTVVDIMQSRMATFARCVGEVEARIALVEANMKDVEDDYSKFIDFCADSKEHYENQGRGIFEELCAVSDAIPDARDPRQHVSKKAVVSGKQIGAGIGAFVGGALGFALCPNPGDAAATAASATFLVAAHASGTANPTTEMPFGCAAPVLAPLACVSVGATVGYFIGGLIGSLFDPNKKTQSRPKQLNGAKQRRAMKGLAKTIAHKMDAHAAKWQTTKTAAQDDKNRLSESLREMRALAKNLKGNLEGMQHNLDVFKNDMSTASVLLLKGQWDIAKEAIREMPGNAAAAFDNIAGSNNNNSN